MTLTPDKSELAQQLADVLEEQINSVHRLYGSTFTKSDCCKHLIKPLLEKHQIDTLLKSLPPKDAQSLGEKHSRLMSCFGPAGELLNKKLSLPTVKRYVNDLIKELRDIAQGSKQSTTATKQKDKRSSKKKPQKSKPIDKRFTFGLGQVLFDGLDLNIGTGAALDITKALIENFGHVVPFQKLDENSPQIEASEKIRTAIGRLRKTIRSEKIPVVIETRKNVGYLILQSTQ